MVTGLRDGVPTRPSVLAFYAISVRRLAVCASGFLQTPSREDALAFGSYFCRSELHFGKMPSLKTVTLVQGTFTPQVHAHAGRTHGTPAEPPTADASRRVCLPLAALSKGESMRRNCVRAAGIVLIAYAAISVADDSETPWVYKGEFHKAIVAADRITVRCGGFNCCQSVDGQKVLFGARDVACDKGWPSRSRGWHLDSGTARVLEGARTWRHGVGGGS